MVRFRLEKGSRAHSHQAEPGIHPLHGTQPLRCVRMCNLGFVQQYMVADPGISDRRRLMDPFIVKALDWRLHQANPSSQGPIQDVYAILGIQSRTQPARTSPAKATSSWKEPSSGDNAHYRQNAFLDRWPIVLYAISSSRVRHSSRLSSNRGEPGCRHGLTFRTSPSASIQDHLLATIGISPRQLNPSQRQHYLIAG